MKNPFGSIRSFALGFSFVASLAAAPALHAAGATTQRDINPTGGVLADGSDGLRLYWGSNSQIQIRLGGSGQVYSQGATPTSGTLFNSVYLRVDRGTNATTRVYTNDNNANGGGFSLFTQTSQSATTGAGTAASPWTVTTVLKPSVAADNGITVTIIDSYIKPQGWFTRHVDVTGLPTSGATVKLYQAIDTYLQGGDNGPGFVRTSPSNTSGIPDVVGVTKNAQFEALWWEPSSGTPIWDRFFSGTYSYPPGLICRSQNTPASPCVTGTGNLDDTVDTNANTDNAIAAQWNVPANATTFTAEYRVTFATAAVDLTKAFSPATIAPNGVSTLTFSLSNKSVNTTASINFLDTLPTGMVVAPTPNIRTNCPAGGAMTGTLPSGMAVVAAAGTGTVKVTGASTSGAAAVGSQNVCMVSVDVTAAAAGTYHNTNASITGTNNLTNLVADEVLNVVVPQLSVTKSVQGSLVAGQAGAAADGYYQIAVQNSGSAPTAGAITLVDTLPAGISATAVSSGNGSISCGALPATGTLTCTFTPSAPIAVGGSATVRINVAIPATATGSLTNTVAAAGGGDPDPLPTCPNAGNAQCAQTTNPVTLSADLSITKTDGSTTYTPGTPVTYTIVVANAGPSNAPNASVTDTLPAALTGATWSCVGSGGATCPPSGAGNLAAVAVSIPVSGQVTFTVSGVVSPAATGSLSNTATVAAPVGVTDPNTANNSATDTDTAALRADIEVVKSGTASVGYGGALSYTVVVTNHGPGNANGTTFSDAVPAGITGVGASCAGMSGGAICVTPSVAGNTVSATIATLPANGSVTYTINGTAPSSGTSITNTASANPPAGTTDPTPGNNAGSATTTLLQPQLTVTKTATPNPFTVGQPASYTITVANTGTGPTSGAITVSDNLPSGITLASFGGANWSCSGTTAVSCSYAGTLAANASTTLILNVTVAANAANANNTATASGGGDAGCPAASRCQGSTTVPVNAAADIAVTKVVDNAAPNVGENVTFTITATNNGPNNATGVAITDALPNGLAFVSATPSQGTYVAGTGLWTVGALANGASATLQLKAAVLQAGTLSNTATKTAGDQFDPVSGNNAGSASLNANPTADLQISKTVDNTTPNLGTNVTYTISVHNAGPNGATGVVIDDLLPLGLNLVTAAPSQGSYNAGTGVWTVGALANAADATLVVVATVTLPGDLTNTASVAATNQHDPNPANDSAGVTINGQSADIQVVKGVDNANPVRGNTITFTITTTNNGPSAATGVAVTDVLPAGISLVSATPSQGNYNSANGVWTIGNLAASGAGATGTLTITASVDTDAGFTNTAALSALDQTDPNPANNSSSVAVAPVANADIEIVKTGPASATAGQNVTYTLAVTNHGPSSAANVSLDDPTPAGLTFVSADAPCATGFPCDLGTLANGATTTVTATFSVPSGATATITNIANASSPTDTTPANDTSMVTTPIVRSADLAVAKSGPASVTADAAISYSVVVTNHGPSDAHGALFSDPVPAAITGVSASCGAPTNGAVCGTVNTTGNAVSSTITTLPTGASVTFTISGDAPVNAATLSNTATIAAPAGVIDPVAGNNTSNVATEVTALADLGVVKTGPASAVAGTTISYTIAVTNHGPSTALAASLADPTPAGLTFISASAPCASGFPCALGDLAAGATVNVDVSYSIPAGFSAASIVNTASASSTTEDPNTGNDSSTATTPVARAADLQVVKTGTASSSYGGALTYSVVVTNHGPSDANGATFTDAVPAGITAISASCGSPTAGAACGTVAVAGSTVSSTITTLPNDASVTFTITGTAPTSGTSITNSASATAPAGTNDPLPGNNTGSATTTLLPPQLTLTKTASPTPFTVGQPASYMLTLTNTGTGSTTGAITVTDNLPSGLTFSSITSGANWNCTGSTATMLNCIYSGTLATNASSTLTLNVNVAANAANANNSATASGGGDSTCPVAAHCIGSVTVPVAASADVAVTKTVDNAAPNVGENVTFTITATNNGPNNATGVAITDALPNGLAFVSATPSQGTYVAGTGLWTVGALANGASASLQLTAKVLTPGSLTNTATKTAGDQFDPDTSNNAGSASLNAQPSADLQVGKTVSNATPNLGTNVTYTITVANAGPNDATGVVVDDQLPPGLVFVSATPSQGTHDDANGVWTVGALANGTSASLAIVATVTLPGDITNTASVATADQHDPNPANNSGGVTVNGQSADIQVVKIVDDANPVRGDTITFTITTTNNGPSNATGVVVTDALPTGLGLVSATPSQGTYNTTTGVWTIGNLAATGVGATATLTIAASVDTDAGFINTASLTSLDQPDPNPANNTSSVPVAPVASADLSIVKTGPATATAGQQVTYTLAVTNHGPSPAANASLDDPTPAGLTFVSADAPCATGFPCDLGTLANGATSTVTVTFAVPSSATASIINTATVTSPTGDPTPSDNSSSVTTPLVRSADIEVHKTGPVTVTASGAITYGVVVTNHGPSDANGTTFSDPVPAAINGVSASCGTPTNGAVCGAANVSGNAVTSTITTLPSGASVTFTINGTAPADAAALSNTATATPPSGVTDPIVINNSSTVDTTVTATADVQVVKSGPNTAVAGTTISYMLAVTNAGPSTAANVSLADPTPTGLTFVSADAPCASGFPCNLGNMASGAGISVTAIYAIPANLGGVVTNIATVSSPTDSTPANNSSAVDTTIAAVADLAVVKTGPATITAGAPISYSVVVSNAGPSDVAGAPFADNVPAGITNVSASCGTPTGGASCGAVNVSGNAVGSTITSLPSGSSVTITINGTAPADAGPISNTATIAAPQGVTDPAPANNSSTANTTVNASADLSIVKNGPQTIASGATISYTLLIHNAGPSAANGASYADVVPAAITGVSATCGSPSGNATCATPNVAGNTVSGSVPTLPAGGSVTITIGGTAPFGAQTLANTATVAAPAGVPDPNSGDNSSSVNTTVGSAADIALAKTVDNAAAHVGEQVMFTITATNNGPNDASGVAVTDSLPSGFAFVSAAPSQGGYDSASGVWTIGDLANGASATMTMIATVEQPGSLTNTVAVSASDQPDPDTSNNNAGASVNAGASADIGLAKTVDNATPNVGSQVTYTLTATNHGPNDATGVEVTDHLPAGVSFVSADPAAAYDAGSGVWTVGALANGASATLAITVQVDAAGAVMNSAAITHEDQFDPVGANNAAGASINGQEADLAVSKTVDNANPNVGDDVTFTVSVHNNGASDATGVVLTDVLPGGLQFVSATPSQGSYAAASGLWTVGTLTAGGATSTATLSVVAKVVADGSITNTASVSAADQPDPNPANNSASASLNGNPQADLAVVKSGPASVTPGDSVVYTIVVTNNGPSDANSVVVTDPTPVGLVFAGNAGDCTQAYPCAIATLASGASATITSTYTVPADYAGANPIVNTASASSATPDPDTTNNQSSAQTNVGPGNADLAIVKSAPATVASGGTIDYTLTITNHGPSPANGASYSDDVPVGITGVTASCGGESGGAACASQPNVSGNTVGGTIGSLPSGGVVIVMIHGIAPQGPLSVTNIATVAAPAGVVDSNSGNDSSSATTAVGAPAADIAVEKSGPQQVVAGTSVVYTLTVTNHGPDAALAVQLDDPTPAGLVFVSASTPCQGGFPCALGDLPNGASTIVTATFAVPVGYAGASIVNTASVTTTTIDPDASNDASSVTTPVVAAATSADLAISKSGPTSTLPGSDVAYTIVVRNDGPDAATNVVVSDPTPAGLGFVGNSGDCASAYPCVIGTLASGASATITSTYAVPANYSGANPIVNTASVASDTPDPDAANNTASATTALLAVPALSADLSIAKSGPATATAGSTVSYTLVIANRGPDAVPDAVLADPTPAGMHFVSADAPCISGFPCAIGALASGASISVTAAYTIDAGYHGSIINTASVNSPTVPDPSANNNASAVTTTISGGGPVEPVTPVPVDARWMLALMSLLLMFVAAVPLGRRRR